MNNNKNLQKKFLFYQLITKLLASKVEYGKIINGDILKTAQPMIMGFGI